MFVKLLSSFAGFLFDFLAPRCCRMCRAPQRQFVQLFAESCTDPTYPGIVPQLEESISEALKKNNNVKKFRLSLHISLIILFNNNGKNSLKDYRELKGPKGKEIYKNLLQKSTLESLDLSSIFFFFASILLFD